MSLRFTSYPESTRRSELEELMFMHPQQLRFRETIITCIDEYGIPKVVERDGGLRIALSSDTEVQCIYALLTENQAELLVGAVNYTRKPSEELAILHIAVKDEFTHNGPRADLMVTFSLLDAVRSVARRIQGFRGVRIAYTRGNAGWRNLIL